MPTAFSTTVAAAQLAGKTNLGSRPDATLNGGAEEVLAVRVQYQMLDSEVTSDTIDLIELPVGAQILPYLCRTSISGDPGTTLTLNIGTTGDVDAFAAVLVLSAGVAAAWTLPSEPAAQLILQRIGGTALGTDQMVRATFATISTLSNTRLLTFDIVYTLARG